MNDGFTEVTMENNETWDRSNTLVGKLVEVKSGLGANNSMLYTLEANGERIGVWGSTVLDTKMAGVQRGSMVKIEPQGEVVSEKTKRTYQDFKVFVKPPEFTEVDAKDVVINDVQNAVNLDNIDY